MSKKENYKRITIRFNELEYKQLENLSKKKKTTKSQALRELLKKRVTNKKIKDFEKIFEIYAEIYLNLSRVCGNINQIAHHLNAGNFVANSEEFFSNAEEMKKITNFFMEQMKKQRKQLTEII